MKKSQVLAALALAFALGLGVVAPVANTYAKVVYPVGTEQTDKDALESDRKATQRAYDNLYQVSQYTTIYNQVVDIEKAFADAEKLEVEKYDDGVWYTENAVDYGRELLNSAYVQAFNDLIGEGRDQLYAYTTDSEGERVYTNLNNTATISQARFNALPEMKDLSDIDSIYANVKSLYDIANNNLAVLSRNYDTTKPIYTSALTFLQGTMSIAGGWLQDYNTGHTMTSTPIQYVQGPSFVSIAEKASKDLPKSDAWKEAANDTFSTNAVRYRLFIEAAKATPKYSAIKGLVDAYKDFSRIASNEAVDYSEAQSFIATMNKAIAAYNGATAPTDPTNPETPAQSVTIWSADGNVSVTGKFEAGKVFVKATKSNKEVKAFDGKKSYIYDIVLTDVNGNEVTPTGEVTVTVKVQGDINGAKSNIYHVDENGKVQLVKSSYKDGVMTFTTSHFSLYAIVEDNGTNLTTPDTGALFGTEGSASTTVAMVAGIATALTAAGAGVVAYRNARRSSRK